MAVVSLVLSATACWPSTRRLVVAKAATRWRGALSAPRSWPRREVLPSMAMRPSRSGQGSRTQAVNAQPTLGSEIETFFADAPPASLASTDKGPRGRKPFAFHISCCQSVV
jgi:hypothetical protein